MRAIPLITVIPMLACSGIEGDTCDDPFVVTSFPYEMHLDLGAMHADISFADSEDPCVSDAQHGKDAVFAIDMTQGQSVTASMICSFANASLFAVYSCSAALSTSQCIDGAERDDPHSTTPAAIQFWAEMDDTYLIIVDHHGPALVAGDTCDLTIDLE